MASVGLVLSAGVDRVDITPSVPIALAGFAARTDDGPARRVLAPLRLRSLVLGDDHGTKVAFVSADLLWWGDDTVALVRHAAAKRLDIAPDAIVLHATHNHSGPQTSRRFTALLGEPDAAYTNQLVEAVVRSIGRALSSPVPVSVERAATTSDLGVNRRSARDGGVVPEPIDREVTVVRFAAHDGHTIAMLVHFACHPVVHHGNAVTSDFAGATMDALERAEPGVVALYAQGSCGDVNPDRYDGTEFRDGGQADIDEMGARLASAVTTALASGTTTVGTPRLAVTHHEVELPTTNRLSRQELLIMADPTSFSRNEVGSPMINAGTGVDGLVGQWSRLLLSDPDRQSGPVLVRATRLGIADDLALVGLSGEPVSAYGLHVKRVAGGRALLLGYTNGMTGYLVTARQLAEGGYEADEAPYYFGMPAPFAPEAEDVLTAALEDLSRADLGADG